MANAKDASEITRNWLDVGKSLVVILVFGWLAIQFAFNRQYLRKAADDLGIDRLSVPGLEISLSKSADALPKADSAITTASTRVAFVERQYAQAIDALKASQNVSVGEETSAAAFRENRLASRVIAEAPATFATIQKTKTQLSSVASATAAAINALPGANDQSLGFGVVFGADKDRTQADNQLSFAKRLDTGEAHLFRRQGYLRSVVVFPTQRAAAAALPRIRSLNNYSASAYVVNLASWCPKADLGHDPVDCAF